jgi:cytochrome P450
MREIQATVYYLLKNPSKLRNLTTEIRSSFKSEADITLSGVNGLKYQNAVISESMRLCPPGPETMRRVVNPGGNIICGDLIPAGVCTTITSLVLHLLPVQ